MPEKRQETVRLSVGTQAGSIKGGTMYASGQSAVLNHRMVVTFRRESAEVMGDTEATPAGHFCSRAWA